MRDLDCSLVVLDGTQPLPFRAGSDRIMFDRILVDAPCSGTGTLGRNPEIKWRLQPSDLTELHAKQVALLRQALQHLCPGGRLVYSTCSLEKEENELVIQEIPGPWQATERLPGLNAGDGFFAAVLSV
jgi:16S rRNA (cytosine967-C5)-methyltransferase